MINDVDLPKIVFEVGLNSNGNTDLANDIFTMGLRAAETTGYPRDLIYFKFQKRYPDVSTPGHMKDVPRVSPVSGKQMTYLEYRHEIEFWEEEYHSFDWLFDRCGGWFASVWDLPSVKYIVEHHGYVPYIKIPSAHLTNYELVEAAFETNIPLILSTGMSTRDEIDYWINEIRRGAAHPVHVLSCTAVYPCRNSEINFFKLDYLRDEALRYFMLRHGFSSHSSSPFPAIYSNFYDVNMIEVHVTKDRALPGSDQAASLEYNGIELLLRETLRIKKLYGPGIFMFPGEKLKRESLRGK